MIKKRKKRNCVTFMKMVETLYVDNAGGVWKLTCAWKVFVSGSEEGWPPRFYPVRRLCNETNRMELRAMGCAVYKLLNKPEVCTGTTSKLEKALPAVLQEARLSRVCKSVPSGAEVRRQMLVLYEFYLSTRTSLTPWLSDLPLSTLTTFWSTERNGII